MFVIILNTHAKLAGFLLPAAYYILGYSFTAAKKGGTF